MEQFCAHFRLLTRWGKHINLTSVLEPQEAARRHFGESLFLHRELPQAATVADIGSGGGFPGLPVGVARPETRVTLVEAKGRKAAFLREAARDLPNVEVARTRLADWTGSADWALARAVAAGGILPDLAGRTRGVALLGTRRPPPSPWGPWRSVRLPWGRERRLWLSHS